MAKERKKENTALNNKETEKVAGANHGEDDSGPSFSGVRDPFAEIAEVSDWLKENDPEWYDQWIRSQLPQTGDIHY